MKRQSNPSSCCRIKTISCRLTGTPSQTFSSPALLPRISWHWSAITTAGLAIWSPSWKVSPGGGCGHSSGLLAGLPDEHPRRIYRLLGGEDGGCDRGLPGEFQDDGRRRGRSHAEPRGRRPDRYPSAGKPAGIHPADAGKKRRTSRSSQ